MKNFLIILFLLMQVNIADAIFSMFVRITPENEAQYQEAGVVIEPLEKEPDLFKVTVIPSISAELVWLIICEEPVPIESQNFRNYILSGVAENQKIVEKRTLYIPENFENAFAGKGEKPEAVTFILDRDTVKRSYIYQDYSQPVLDGGYYFTVDLNSYLE